jgi:hypothetical protein
MGGATSKTPEVARVVSRYHAFIESMEPTDITRLLKAPIDENGVIRKPGFPQFDCILSLLGEKHKNDRKFEDEIDTIMWSFRSNHWDTYRALEREFRLNEGLIERVDVSDLSDWFPLFLVSLYIHHVHLVVTTEFNMIKLTRALMLLFVIGNANYVYEITISFRSSLLPFVNMVVADAQAGAITLTTTRTSTFYSRYIMNKFGIGAQSIDKWMMMSLIEDDGNGTAHLTYEFDPITPPVKKLK